MVLIASGAWGRTSGSNTSLLRYAIRTMFLLRMRSGPFNSLLSIFRQRTFPPAMSSERLAFQDPINWIAKAPRCLSAFLRPRRLLIAMEELPMQGLGYRRRSWADASQ